MQKIENYMNNIRRNLLSEYANSNTNSLAGFACKCEISASELGHIIWGRKGQSAVRLSTLATISNALGKSISWLIGEDKGAGVA